MRRVNTPQENVMIDPDDAVMLLTDHQSGLFQLVKDIQICSSFNRSPVKLYRGYGNKAVQGASSALAHRSHPLASSHGAHTASGEQELWGPLGCDCFAF